MSSTAREDKIIDKVISLLSGSPELLNRFRHEISALTHKKEIAKANKYRLAVMGVTSSGKSTMLNALIGKQLLPSVAIPSSSQLVSCVKGNGWSATVFFENGSKKLFNSRQLSPKIISDYGEEKNNPGNKKGVSQIEISTPSLCIPDDIIIEDSPGLDAYGLEGHEHLTMHMLLPSTDFCLFVTTCKTNSDLKTLKVLNEIAKYGKPVIIVQNMIDSIKGLPDGSKSASEVAKDHIVRIQRIVDKSNIKDKSSLHIVQISAMYAMAVREFLNKGNRSTHKSDRLWKESNFDELCRVITDVFNQVKPQIEAKRLSALKKELVEINSNIIVKNIAQTPTSNIDFETLKTKINGLYINSKNRITKGLQELTDLAKSYSNRSYCTINDIDNVRTRDVQIVSIITDIMTDYNNSLNSICETLHLSTRDFSIRIPVRNQRSISATYKTETYKVKKDGFWNSVKRFWGFSSGYETKTRQVSDDKENKNRIMLFLQQAYDDLEQKTEDWFKKVVDVKEKILAIVENKEAQYKAAHDSAHKERLSQQTKNSIKEELQKIINDIREIQTSTYKVAGNRHHAAQRAMVRVELPQDTFGIISISKNILDRIHKIMWTSILNQSGCDVITWDLDCAGRFLHTAFGIKMVGVGIYYANDIGYVKVTNANTDARINLSGRKLIVMINATQPGAAKKQLMTLLTDNTLSYKDVIFLIQDLQEVINGGDLSGSLRDLYIFFSALQLRDYMLLPFHLNPIYGIAMLESHRRKIATHSEEMKLRSDLNGYLDYLFEENSQQIIADIIRSKFEYGK